jgi:DNA-binding transcriptional regulator YdaS (Cro superfamily)
MGITKHPIDVASEIVGSQTLLAAALGVTKGAVPQWRTEGRRVPAEHCPSIERLTGGRVRCEDLRPDIDWAVLRRPSTPDAVEATATTTTNGA